MLRTTLDTPHSAVFFLHSALYTLHSTLHTPQSPLHTLRTTFTTQHSTVFALYTLQSSAVHSVSQSSTVIYTSTVGEKLKYRVSQKCVPCISMCFDVPRVNIQLQDPFPCQCCAKFHGNFHGYCDAHRLARFYHAFSRSHLVPWIQQFDRADRFAVIVCTRRDVTFKF